MWNLFKIINILWLFSSTYWWITATMSLTPILVLVNVLMWGCSAFLPGKLNIDMKLGVSVALLLAISVWYTYIDGVVMGILVVLMYLPVFTLIRLPGHYQRDLLKFTIKWYAILLIPAIAIYAITLVRPIPWKMMYEHPNYKPYVNYIFYLKTTYDYGTFDRFNAFFLEPGHQALLSTFLIIADKFRYKSNPWLWVLSFAVLISFSLAGYLLLAVGFVLLKINSIAKMLAVGVIFAGVIVGLQNLSGGNNAFNELIISRMERDKDTGVKGNNRFAGDTDYVYARALKKGDAWVGVYGKVNTEDVVGAGYKIYIIHYGFIGALLALGFYLSLIPNRPDWRYTAAFLIVLLLCFMQRSYPTWYSWLMPYVLGIYLAKSDRETLPAS